MILKKYKYFYLEMQCFYRNTNKTIGWTKKQIFGQTKSLYLLETNKNNQYFQQLCSLPVPSDSNRSIVAEHIGYLVVFNQIQTCFGPKICFFGPTNGFICISAKALHF